MKKTLLSLMAGILLGAGAIFIWAQARESARVQDEADAAARHAAEIQKLRKEITGERQALGAMRRQFAEAGVDTTPVKEGEIDIQRLLNDARPLMKTLAIMFGKERAKLAERMITGFAERLAEEMGLTEEQTAAMIAHFLKVDSANFEKIKEMLDKPMTILSIFSAMQDMNPTKNMDEYVLTKLNDDQKKAWENRKLETKAQQIERTANWQLQRMDKLNLDETQKDQVFDILVKKNPQYDASLAVEGLNTESAFDAGKSQEAAIAAVLREEQMAEYTAMQERQNKGRQRWANALGGFDPMQFMQGMSGMEPFGGGFGGRGGGRRGRGGAQP